MSNADPPADNELEISIFGPGYGESILLHVGAKEWAIINSCLNETRQSAPLCYLESLGIEPASAVRVVVATHWHDDHIRGLSDIVRACTAAKFSCSLAFSKRDFFAMVTRYRKRNEIEGGSGVNEIFKIFKSLESRHQDPTYALANRPIFRFTGASALLGGECILTALSPSDAQLALFLKEIAALIPGSGTMRRAAPRTPNNVATVVWLSIGAEECVLLGSDLEETKDPLTGWSIIVEFDLRPVGVASVFKISHHGSETGYSADIWHRMLRPGAHAILTPFSRGSVLLPTEKGTERILGHTNEAYSTSHLRSRSVRRRNQTVERTIREVVGSLRTVESRFGQVRLRKVAGSPDGWGVELFGSACRLEHISS